MRLTDLEPQFLRIENPTTYAHVDDIHQAQGVCFLCPVCFKKNNGPVGTHSIICWFTGRGVPDGLHPVPGRWNAQGTGYHDLTFAGPGAASILLQGGCNAHFFIRNGEIQFT
jgi:hypothetical protein